MSLVYVVYTLMAFQGVILFLYFTGKSYIFSMILEVAFASLHLLFHVLLSGMKWILPSRKKNLKGEVALVTGAASGIGRLMSLRLAEKG